MRKSMSETLRAFVSGRLTSTAAKGDLLAHFSTSVSVKYQAITQQYIDEIMADLEAGTVTIAAASEGLEESAAASYL